MAALDELRATAPAFAEQARALAAKEQFDEASEKLDYAAKLRPDAAEYLAAKGDLLQCQLKLAEAASAYRAASHFARATHPPRPMPRSAIHCSLRHKGGMASSRAKASAGSISPCSSSSVPPRS